MDAAGLSAPSNCDLLSDDETVDLYEELADLNRDAYLPDLAGSVNNLASRLAEAGRRADGLAAAQEAVQVYSELAESEPVLYALAAGQAAEFVAGLLEGEVP